MLKHFREKVKQREEVYEERREEKMERQHTAREARFAQDITRLWREASWIMVTNDFPNGKPMHDQFPWHLAIWDIFVSAINARQWGAESLNA